MEDNDWEEVIMIVESGVAETVVNKNMTVGIPIEQSEKVGREYEVAIGDQIKNDGQNMLK